MERTGQGLEHSPEHREGLRLHGFVNSAVRSAYPFRRRHRARPRPSPIVMGTLTGRMGLSPILPTQ